MEYRWDYQGKPSNHAASIAFLTQYGPRIAEIANKYPAGDPYWPPLAPGWALSTHNVETLLESHRQALKAP